MTDRIDIRTPARIGIALAMVGVLSIAGGIVWIVGSLLHAF